jgi:hypothetical protein
MRKLVNLLMIVGIASLATFTSCKKDDTTTTPTPTDTTVAPVKITIATSPSSVRVYQVLKLDITFAVND